MNADLTTALPDLSPVVEITSLGLLAAALVVVIMTVRWILRALRRKPD